MKRLFAFAAIVLSPLLLMGQSTDFKFTQDGSFASLGIFTPQPFSSVSLSVSAGTGSGTSLQYSAVSETADFTSITITNVFGPIPSSAFTGQNTQLLSLSIDTSTLAPGTLFSETCTIDLTNGNETCGAGPAGLIQLAFRENDAISTTVNSHTTTQVGPVTTKTNQHSDNSTATVQGTVFGADVSAASAQVGINHMSTIEITRN